MNENLNLIELLKDCPIGTKLYSSVHGEVELEGVHLISKPDYPIEVRLSNNALDSFTPDGRLFAEYNGECMLFPSREQRDWGKFKPKKTEQQKFGPKTLQPFDKVLARNGLQEDWCCHFFSHCRDINSLYKYVLTDGCAYIYCIPYNDDTKHLLGTKEEAPGFYCYWGKFIYDNE